MHKRGLYDRFLSAATGIVTLCALLLVALRLRDEFFPRDNASEPLRVKNWQAFSAVGHRQGPANAPVTIVEFSDFQCPYCRKAAAYLSDLQARRPTEVAVVYRHYPIHDDATAAAVASECAADVGKFSSFRDLLFANSDSISKRSWASYAREVGISDTAQFVRCLHDGKSIARVTRDTVAAHALSVQGTPTFLINDLEITGFKSKEDFDQLVTNALGKARR